MGSLVDKVYAVSPAFVQNIGISLVGWKLRRAEYGQSFQEMLEEFERTQWFSSEELRAYQNDQLARLIRHAYDHVPYYRQVMHKRKLHPDDIKTIDDLPKLPVLTKDDVRTNARSLIADNADRSRLKPGHTGGTTGSPLSLWYDNSICVAKNAADWRQKRWAGINPGDRIGIFWGRILIRGDRNKPPFWRSNWVMNQLYFSTYHLSPSNLNAYVKQLARFRPRTIEGYPSTLHVLARHMLDEKITLPITAVFTSSETLFPHQREAIEQAFACPVYDYYGMAERVLFATECPKHTGLHLNSDFGITEVLDGNREPVGPGETGRLTATGLYNYAMPLIRYITSDISSVSTASCSCGRTFPLLGEVTSRADDMIVTTDGRYLSFASLSLPFKQMKHISQAQIIQESAEYLRIKIVRKPGYEEADSECLRSEFAKRIGATARIEIELVESIPRSPSGKLRFAISKVKPEIAC